MRGGMTQILRAPFWTQADPACFATQIKEADTTAGKAGFVLADIYALAKRFKRLPTEEQQALRVGEGGFHDGPFERFRKDY